MNLLNDLSYYKIVGEDWKKMKEKIGKKMVENWKPTLVKANNTFFVILFLMMPNSEPIVLVHFSTKKLDI